jgi:hypothetical protein
MSTTIPVITPATSTTTLTTGVAGDITNLEQDALNFLPVIQNASTAIKAAAAAPAANGFHKFLNIFSAADAAITPYVPVPIVQEAGGLAEVIASLLNLIPGGAATTTTSTTSTATTPATTVTATVATPAVPAATTTTVTTTPATTNPATDAPASSAPAASSSTTTAVNPLSTASLAQLQELQAQVNQQIATLTGSGTTTATPATASTDPAIVTPTQTAHEKTASATPAVTASAIPSATATVTTTATTAAAKPNFFSELGSILLHPKAAAQGAESVAEEKKAAHTTQTVQTGKS